MRIYTYTYIPEVVSPIKITWMAEVKVKLGFTPSLARTPKPNLLNGVDQVKCKVGSGKAVAFPHSLPAMTLRETCLGGIPSPAKIVSKGI